MIATLLRNNRDLVIVIAVFAILVILFAPIPPAVLDLAIVVNFGFGLTILLLTFYVSKPVDFSTFPSLLLIVTLLRLAINVAATRLILTGADAGDVINAIGNFAVQGNYVVGLVVFLILVVVQFVVVTNGAQRVSEVAARFTLDSMPGQQMSIDADLNMGLIDQQEAQRRRHELEKEAAFYGAMDGASKFVKGDAIAAIIIMLINIIAGSLIGILQMDLSWSEALQRFTLLTIGDGIAAQLPALIVAVATGIIVTRSSADRELSTEILYQLGSVRRIPLIVGAALTFFMLLPGMPKWPIIILLAVAAVVWWRSRGNIEAERTAAGHPEQASSTGLRIDQPTMLEIALGPDLAEAWRDARAVLLERLNELRTAHFSDLGAVLPAIRIVDGSALGPLDYEIRLAGSRFGSATVYPDRYLAIASDPTARIAGEETIDPAFGLRSFWIDDLSREEARESGFSIVDPMSLLLAHLREIFRSEASMLLSRSAVVDFIEQVRVHQAGLVDDLIPNLLTVPDLHHILRMLLSEGVTISAAELILDNLADLARSQRDTNELAELLRQRMAHIICDKLRGMHRELAVISLEPRLENQLTEMISVRGQRDLGFEPRLAEQLIRNLSPHVEGMFAQGRAPVLLCGPEIRRPIRNLTKRSLPRLSVLSVNEIPNRIGLSSFAVVRVELATT